ncbi:aminotransferase class V-fold PLP-dependent enzyme [Anthocerotibacter panamensis]|uniref:aminotransferase class V-fold PLP-dependent enzyme n=1 Tax=Anthocerotibacter panamensis TaxID=2857077 RepID=UPI0036F21A49
MQHRSLFPALANKTYLNFGGQGPLPQPALEALYHAYQEIQQRGPFSGATAAWMTQQLSHVRTRIATELGASPDTITLTENVSVGCNIALWGLDWQAGDHLLLSDCEYPGVLAAVAELQRRFQIEVSTCPLAATLNEGDPVAVVSAHLKPHTRLVVLSHIFWNTGQVLPLADIIAACHAYTAARRPIRVLVDAAQSVGVLPLNLTDLAADFYAFTGHKWWCGPEGVGGLYVRPEAQADLHPTFISWRGLVGAQLESFPDGRRFEIGTSAYPLQVGLATALDIHAQWGTPQERYHRIQALAGYLWRGLTGLPLTCLQTQAPQAGLVTFSTGSAPLRLVQFLEAKGLQVRVIPQPACVRVCVHYLTLTTEIDHLLEGIQQFYQQ